MLKYLHVKTSSSLSQLNIRHTVHIYRWLTPKAKACKNCTGFYPEVILSIIQGSLLCWANSTAFRWAVISELLQKGLFHICTRSRTLQLATDRQLARSHTAIMVQFFPAVIFKQLTFRLKSLNWTLLWHSLRIYTVLVSKMLLQCRILVYQHLEARVISNRNYKKLYQSYSFTNRCTRELL